MFSPAMKPAYRLGHWLCFLAGCALGSFLVRLCPVTAKSASSQLANGKDLWPLSFFTALRPHVFEDMPLEDRKHLYIYEKNMKSGSTSWSAMLAAAATEWDTLPCWETSLLNALEANSHEITDRDALMVCHIRRMSLSRERPARIISSFNLEKDMVISAYMEQKNLTIELVDKNSTDFLKFMEGFKRTWQIDYMGYSNFKDRAFRPHIVCPLSQEMKDVVRIAAGDTFLPISHDLPCMSKVLIRKMVGLEIGETLHLNVRGNGKPAKWEHDLSCFDVEMSKAMTTKMAKLYDGTDLSDNYYWREGAKRIERKCIEDESKYTDIASAR